MTTKTAGWVPAAPELLWQSEIWYTNGSHRVLIRDMGDQHITNLLAWLERKSPSIQASLEEYLFRTTCGDHGDMAQDAIDSMFAELDMEPVQWVREQPLYKALKDELTRRQGMSENSTQEVTVTGEKLRDALKVALGDRERGLQGIWLAVWAELQPEPEYLAEAVVRQAPPEKYAAEQHYRDGLDHLDWAQGEGDAAWHQRQALALFAAAQAAAAIYGPPAR